MRSFKYINPKYCLEGVRSFAQPAQHVYAVVLLITHKYARRKVIMLTNRSALEELNRQGIPFFGSIGANPDRGITRKATFLN